MGYHVFNGSPNLKKDLRTIQDNGEPEIHERVDLRAWTALGVGGLADLLVRCRSADGLQRAIDVLATHGQRWLVLGAGSRLVPTDRGLRVPVVNLSGTLGLWELDLDGAVAGGGANLAQVCRAAARTGMSGFDDLMRSGSSIGGAIQAASQGQRELAGILDWVDLARPGRGVERIRVSGRNGWRPGIDLDLDRRIVIRARLQLVSDTTVTSPGGILLQDRHRGQRQPRSAEPFFVDPAGGRAFALLTETGCVDLKVGGARLSQRNPNCIRTVKTARASDVLELTRAVRERVQKRLGIELLPSICFVDEDGRVVDL
jgi:UDP-N-acetylmuramate dehydrogenase